MFIYQTLACPLKVQYIHTSRFRQEMECFLFRNVSRTYPQDISNCITSNHLNTNKLCECDEKFWIEIPTHDVTPIEVSFEQGDRCSIYCTLYT